MRWMTDDAACHIMVQKIIINMNKKIITACMTAAGAAVAAGLPFRIDETFYRISAPEIKHQTRICVLSDLHSSTFGKNQKHIVERVHRARPDLIVMPGDIIDDKKDSGPAFELVSELGDYPLFYVEGNHERRMTDDVRIRQKQKLKDLGAHVLEDNSVIIETSGIEIAGLHSMHHQPDCTPDRASQLFSSRWFRILLSHRPWYPEFYSKVDCDLIISGHAHGGQWRIPFINQGIYAPQEGLFPKFAQGLIDLGPNSILISRGLNRRKYFIPRLYNNPEICYIDIIKN